MDSLQYQQQFGMAGYGRCGYLDQRVEPLPNVKLLTYHRPRYFVLKYKKLLVYEFKDDAKCTWVSDPTRRSPVVEMPMTEKVKISKFTPATGEASHKGRKRYYFKLVHEKLGKGTVIVVDALSQQDLDDWMKLIRQAQARNKEEAFEAEARDKETAKQLQKEGLDLAADRDRTTRLQEDAVSYTHDQL